MASRILTRMGNTAIPLLVREAISTGKRPDHRIRLLEILLVIGGKVSADDWFSLVAASRVYRGRVREKIAQVLMKLGHAGPWMRPVGTN